MLKKSTILFAFVFFLLFIGLNTVSYAAPMNEKGKRCSDGIDNDGDGLIDGDDPDCVGDGGGGETLGTFEVSFDDDAMFLPPGGLLGMTEFDFLFSPDDNRLTLVESFSLLLTPLVDPSSMDPFLLNEGDAENCFGMDLEVTIDAGSFIGFSDKQNDIGFGFVAHFTAFATDGMTLRDYNLVFENNDLVEMGEDPAENCRDLITGEVNFFPDLNSTCEGEFIAVNLRTRDKKSLDKIAEPCRIFDPDDKTGPKTADLFQSIFFRVERTQ